MLLLWHTCRLCHRGVRAADAFPRLVKRRRHRGTVNITWRRSPASVDEAAKAEMNAIKSKSKLLIGFSVFAPLVSGFSVSWFGGCLRNVSSRPRKMLWVQISHEITAVGTKREKNMAEWWRRWRGCAVSWRSDDVHLSLVSSGAIRRKAITTRW